MPGSVKFIWNKKHWCIKFAKIKNQTFHISDDLLKMSSDDLAINALQRVYYFLSLFIYSYVSAVFYFVAIITIHAFYAT